MNIMDMFLTPSAQLSESGLLLTELSADPDEVRYLLYRLSSGKGTLSHPFSYTSRAFPAYGLLYIASGCMEYSSLPTPGRPVTLQSDSLFLWDCRTPHSISTKLPTEYELLFFDGYSAAYYCSRLFHEESSHLCTAAAEEQALLHQLVTASSMDSMSSHLSLTRLLTHMVLHTLPALEEVPVYLTQLKAELETHYYEEHSLAELEQKYHVNRYRICRDFKKYYQIAPLQYLHSVRIRNAQLLLKETNMKIHEISYEVGYENVNHFIRHFKKTAGTTPAEYRKHTISFLTLDSHSP